MDKLKITLEAVTNYRETEKLKLSMCKFHFLASRPSAVTRSSVGGVENGMHVMRNGSKYMPV